ncbi:tRNA uridine 5-carboxymethylaminomethyl modification enzyme MnmG [bacterium HR11]|nr:tRNA uridine 5-carboxymethylaminomethyl modification enzyme MnmG [bacterium HR11]
MRPWETFEVVVIGGGHAGIEAAHAAARIGCETALVTMDVRAIGRMSCNPAIGGIGKGQIVREIDALGGVMGKLADATGIQFRLLNRKKGPAVWSPRCQSDKARYAEAAQRLILSTPRLTVVEGTADELLVDGDRIVGVRLQDGRVLGTRAVVIASGTFMNGLIHIGLETQPAGRIGEPPAVGLPESLRRLGFEMGRLKTGTPPRLLRESVRYDVLEVQEGDPDPVFFSFDTTSVTLPQTVCWITYTNPEVHEIIRSNLHVAPMYCGRIRGIGPRYCPSIEDKVVRFADKTHHQLFLEPEGLDPDTWIYINGLSTSLPREIQEEVVHRIRGLEDAVIVRYAYAVEYDFVRPHQLKHTLETKRIEGLFHAGQINGTTGYEEAAGQGLVAGINAALKVRGRPPLVLSRHESYIGIMIDDLVTKGVEDPYRMFTSRAELRLLLRIDNADLRLSEYGYRIGLLPEERWERVQRKRARLQRAIEFMNTCRPGPRLKPGQTHPVPLRGHETLAVLLKRPEMTLDRLLEAYDLPEITALAYEEKYSMELEVKYEGYIRRQLQEVERMKKRLDLRIPPDFPVDRVPGLRKEIVEKLQKYRPETLADALRIQGVTPAAVVLLSYYIDRWQRTGRITS